MLIFYASILSFILSLMASIFTIIAYKKRHNDENKNNLKACLFTALLTCFMTFISVPIEKPQIYPKFGATYECINYAEITIDAPFIFKIYYSLDGSAPDEKNIYSKPFIITESTVVTAKCKFLWWESELVENSYTIVENIPDDSAASITKISMPTSDYNESERTNPYKIHYMNSREPSEEALPKILIFSLCYTDFDVEKELQKIMFESSRIQNIENMEEPTEQNSVYKYCISNQVNLIKVYRGYNDFDYSRMYLFRDSGELYFAYIYNEDEEHKLYFYNNDLMTYVVNGETFYDFISCMDRCEFEKFVIEEAYTLW